MVRPRDLIVVSLESSGPEDVYFGFFGQMWPTRSGQNLHKMANNWNIFTIQISSNNISRRVRPRYLIFVSLESSVPVDVSFCIFGQFYSTGSGKNLQR